MECDTVTYTENPSVLKQRLIQSWQRVLNLPVATITGSFRKLLETVFDENYPVFRKSALRALMEGSLENAPCPVLSVRPVAKRTLETVLILMDFLETLSWMSTQSRIDALAPALKTELAQLNSIFGTSKIPGLTEALLNKPIDKKRRPSNKSSHHPLKVKRSQKHLT